MPIKQGHDNPLWFCTQCGDDFRRWMQLPGEVRREFLRQRPPYDITRLLEDRCPRCGSPYLTKATGRRGA
jgi:DNA-directed RNA polymerase subunit RPC12/RpoP